MNFKRNLIAVSKKSEGIACLYDTKDEIVVENLYIIIVSIVGAFILITVTVLAVVYSCS